MREQIAAVEAVLGEIGGGSLPVELVLNKIDLVDALGRRRLANRFPHVPMVSAATGAGVVELEQRIADRFADRFEDVRLLVPYDAGGVLAELYGLGAPIGERDDTEEGVVIRARLPHREVRRFAPYLIGDARAETASRA